jgi:hypothetical protein
MYCKVLKLSTGETIIGSIVEETKIYVDVEKPIKVVVAPIGKDSFNVMLIKWDPMTDFNLPSRIFKTSIVSVGEPTHDFRESYMEIYNKYDSKEDEIVSERDEVDDLSDELETLVNVLGNKTSSNATYH